MSQRTTGEEKKCLPLIFILIRICFLYQDRDSDTLYRSAHTIQSRTERISSVVTAEMDNFEPGLYTERVLEAVKMLNDQTMPTFATKVKGTVQTINDDPDADIDENDFMETTLHIFNGVRDIREAVLLNRGAEDPDSPVESDTDTISSRGSSRTSSSSSAPSSSTPVTTASKSAWRRFCRGPQSPACRLIWATAQPRTR